MLETYNKRKKLKPRNAPYWQKLSVGKYIGFYRTESGGAWRARILIDGQRYFSKLGGDIRSEYEDILNQANEWFDQTIKLSDPKNTKHTVQSVVDDYINHLEIEKSNDAAYRTRKQLEKHLLPTLKNTELSKLTTSQLKKWRDSLVKTGDDPEAVRKSKDSVNRLLSMTKAAFNMAFRDGVVGTDVEWKRVTPFKNVGTSRTLFLTDAQVARLVKCAAGGLHDLIKGGIYTGARAGELLNVQGRDYDAANGAIELEGKTGKRSAYLSVDANKYFAKLTRNKLPKAFIFTQDDGKPWAKMAYGREFKKVVRASKLPADTVFYSLRHYHISKALVAGIPSQIVSENCGTSIRMLEKHYAKFMAQDRRSMMDKVALGI